MFNADYVIVFWYDVLFVEQLHTGVHTWYWILNKEKLGFKCCNIRQRLGFVHFPSLWQSCLRHLLAKIKDQPESPQTHTDHIVLVWKFLYTAGPKWIVYFPTLEYDGIMTSYFHSQLRITTTYLHKLIYFGTRWLEIFN